MRVRVGRIPWVAVFPVLAAAGMAVAEITPMARERFPEALQLAREAARNDWPVIYMDICRTPKHPHVFDVTVTTPFAAAAYVAFEAVRDGKPIDLDRWPIEKPERQTVIVAVDPSDLKHRGPASVATLFLRRGARIIEPLRSDTHQVHFPDGAEGPRVFRGGTYYFPLEPFASELGDLEIVVIPQAEEAGEEAIVTLSKEHLSRMR